MTEKSPEQIKQEIIDLTKEKCRNWTTSSFLVESGIGYLAETRYKEFTELLIYERILRDVFDMSYSEVSNLEVDVRVEIDKKYKRFE